MVSSHYSYDGNGNCHNSPHPGEGLLKGIIINILKYLTLKTLFYFSVANYNNVQQCFLM